MKATLEFDFADPEEKKAGLRAAHADDVFWAVSTFLEECRRREKYDGDEKAGEFAKLLRSDLQEVGVDLDSLYS